MSADTSIGTVVKASFPVSLKENIFIACSFIGSIIGGGENFHAEYVSVDIACSNAI